jgi:hypothetical protein
MKWRQRFAALGVVAVVLLGAQGASGQASTREKPSPVEVSAEEVWASTGGRYSDEYGRILVALGTPVSTDGEIANAQGSTRFSTLFQVENEERVVVHLQAGRDSATDRAEIEALVARVAPGFVVEFGESMEYSQADLLALGERIDSERATLLEFGVAIQGAIPDTDRQIVLVPTDDSTDRVAAQRILSERYGPAVEVVGSYRTNGRHNDVAPYYGGIPLDIPVGGLYPDCTAGFAVNKPGYGNYMLTAGHCVGFNTGVSVSTHGGNYIGYSSATDGNADAALITGSYAARIWIDGVTSTTSRPVAGPTATEKLRDVVCAGGARTGQVCRNRITDLNYVTPTGARTVVACNWEGTLPSRPGDSGGPVYRVDSANKLWGHGIINGSFDNTACFAYVPMWKVTERTGAVLRTSP